MMSAHKIGAEHVNYYLSYVERGGDAGRWLGKGAEALGLTGEVTPEAFANLAEGRQPDGTKLLERIHADRVMGWDMTMSAPKSLSLLAVLHPDEEMRTALRDVHDRAVAAGLAYLEDVGGAARRGYGGRDGHVGAQMVIAGFVHKTSREGEPDLHEHGIILNVGLGEDGRWTSIDSRWAYAHKAGAEAIYRSELYKGAAELGVVWEAPDVHGNREVAGFSRAELRDWSTRRANIEDELARTGGSGRRAAEAAALATRKTKVDVEFTALVEQWRTRARDEGLSPRRLAKMAGGSDRRLSLSDEELLRAKDQILSLGDGGLLEGGSAFTVDAVVRAWVDHLPSGASREYVEELVEDTLDDPRVVPLVVADHEGHVLTGEHGMPKNAKTLRLVRSEDLEASRCQLRYSTQAMLAMEARVIDAVGATRQAGVAMVDPGLVEAVLARHPTLTLDQVEMVRAITTSGHGVDAVVGPPGSGKSFAIGVAREIWEQAGYRLQGSAPSGKAAVELGSGAGIDSTTLAAIVAPNTPTSIVKGGVLILDEAGMANTLDMDAVLAMARQAGTKVVALGDPRQIAAVGAGGTFAGIVERFGASELTENGRQAEDWERAAIKALRDGRSGEAVASYVAHGRLVVADVPEDLMSGCVTDWWAARPEGEVAMYAATRAQVWRLNALARARMAEAGQLSGPEMVVGAVSRGGYALPERTFAAGDEVLLGKNRAKVSGDVVVTLADGTRRHQGIKNGQRARIVEVDGQSGQVTVTHQDGRVLTLAKDYVEQYLAHGYAITAHKAQGETVGEAGRVAALGIIAEADRRKGKAFVYGLADAELGLVMASRATDSTRFYVLATAETHLYDEGSQIEPVDPAASLARSWGRSAAPGMAGDELERARVVKRLAAGFSAKDLAERRDSLVALERGDQDPAVALEVARSQREAARTEVEAARRTLAEAILDIEDAREVPTPDASTTNEPTLVDDRLLLSVRPEPNRPGGSEPAPTTPGLPSQAADVVSPDRRVIEAEARAEAALIASRTAEAALRLVEAAQSRRAAAVAATEAEIGGDRRRVAADLALLDEALATQRRWSLDALAAQPPTWAADLIGARPSERASALRWREGLTLIDDVRKTAGFDPAAQDDDPMVRALGQRPDQPFARPGWDHHRACLQRVRVDLGLEVPDSVAVGQETPATEERAAALERLTEASRRRWQRPAQSGPNRLRRSDVSPQLDPPNPRSGRPNVDL
ncbi:MAG: hypothetical protein DLM54_00345 [Acidimicrobiales bacterium]|nr:MAG: hypothetical protein DLM54_00345 [Acidimicrobiales bacterium]